MSSHIEVSRVMLRTQVSGSEMRDLPGLTLASVCADAVDMANWGRKGHGAIDHNVLAYDPILSHPLK